MKNRRDVCMAKDAGYMEFQGLPGKVKTGCQASPSYKSRYCTSHTPQGCNPVKCIDDEELKETGSNIGIQQKSTDHEVGNVIAEVIVAKKTTRKDTYYQVIGGGRRQLYSNWSPEIRYHIHTILLTVLVHCKTTE